MEARNHLLKPGRLLNGSGHLNSAGYAKEPVMDYRRGDVKGGRFRIKEWDYYLVTCEEFGVAFTVDDNSYMGLAGVSFLDFKRKTEHTVNLMNAFPMGRTGMPESSKTGNACWHNKRADIRFLNDSGSRRLLVSFKRFEGENDLIADIRLTELPGQESMVIATPFQKKKTAFYYNQKIVGMKAEGTVKIGNRFHKFNGPSFGLLDWGRGVWTYDNTWYWGAGQGVVNGEVFGFNLGCGFGDTSRASENMLFYKGKAHKLDDVRFIIPKDGAGREQFEKPWKFVSSDRRFEMDFMPILDRKNKTSAGVILSDQHQVFGKFTGRAVLDDGTEIRLSDFLGFAEKVRNKW